MVPLHAVCLSVFYNGSGDRRHAVSGLCQVQREVLSVEIRRQR
jgi:hypothetical protein